ncbi:Alkaline protease secretion ATP-binding protein AprD [Rubrivivax sp. A210]|uniref:type I secretion system permease/ATPase n=1 Tax=Rubrivivax sp. A210 TaxID=2772301 RepID=UPI001918662A|nr:type I secretion system permease/ATPase [Rubrivivax sp. A210]CAD5365966.1 Alkaline protease secretion ATP-binding protein AprD [Rubrivivax sp. A210]
MKLLLAELKPLLAHQAAFSFVINLLFLVPAIFTLQVFDRVIPSNSVETLAVLLMGVGIALAILLMLDYARLRLQHLTGNLIDERLSPPVIHTLVKATALAPQAVRADAVRDVGLLRNLFSANGVTALFDAPWVIVYVGVIWLFHPLLGMGAAACVALMLVLAWLNDRFSRAALDTLQTEGLRASRYVEGSLRNAEVLQAMGMTERLLGRWRQQQDAILALQTRATRTSVAFIAVTKFVRQAIQVLMMALGAYLVLTQRASAGVMIATTILLGRAVQPVEQLVGSWRTLSDARAAYRRLLELSKYFDAGLKRVALPRPEGRVTVDAVSFRPPHADKMLLAGVSLQLEPGEALAIIGPSAAGKSTLVRLMTGIWQPSAGKVRLDGVDVADWPREALGPWIGYVPQDVELFDGTVAENIGRLNELDSEAVIKAARRANAHELIVQLPQGYDTPVGDQGLRLSPGQRQRIALARAMYGDVRLLILDEPNSSLDSEGEMALARALSDIRAQGVTSIVVTHRPSLIAHVDKILILEAGRVTRFGPAAEVMKGMQKLAQATLQAQAA